MTKVVFQSTQLSLRGTEVALFDYARYNEEIIGNESVILFDETSPLNNPEAIRRFESRFPVAAYRRGENLDRVVAALNADLLYFIKLDRNNFSLSGVVPTMMHEVFPVVPSMFHGSAYAFVSRWLSVTFSNGRVPVVPHIVTLPDVHDDLRRELGIPAEATVFGCHGGKESFDIAFVKRVVKDVLEQRSEVYFVFLNIRPFAHHPRLVFLEGTADVVRKVMFINTCDAMLHARRRGETFGLACAEFSLRNKPVFTYALSGERNHIETLGNKAQLYKGPGDLRAGLLAFDPVQAAGQDWDCYSRNFSPEAVMPLFDRFFIQQAQKNGLGDGDWSLSMTDHMAVLRNRLRIRGIKSTRAWHRHLG